ncbi:MAG: hypothetical protein Q7R33_01625, partial [Nitrosarchaeum sp.]|nr:hypothetical protein [Nitrosarchaeum sp.]
MTEEETILVNIVYWARNKRFPRDYVFRNQFYHGPHGHKAPSHSKKSWSWLPNPAEGCDNLEVGITEVDSKPDVSAKPKFNPWIWFIHCKSYQHIAYLVKHRKHFLLHHHFDIQPFEAAYKSFTKLTLEERKITNPFPLESVNPLPFDYTMDTLNVDIRPYIYFYC